MGDAGLEQDGVNAAWAVMFGLTIVAPFVYLAWEHYDAMRRCPVCQDFFWPPAVNGRPDASLCDRHYQIQWDEHFMDA